MARSFDMSRRSFLTGAAAVASLSAVGAISGCAPKGEAAPQNAEETQQASAKPSWLGEAPEISDADCVDILDFEVVVVGAGTSGYFAAASAAENGAKTLLIEKSPAGNGIRSSALGAVNSKAQKERGISIDIPDIVNNLSSYAQGRADTRLIRKWAENSGEAIDWYTDLLAQNGMEVQLEWSMPEGTRYLEWPVGHGTNGEYPAREGEVSKIFDAYITSFDGCEERFSTVMRRLIADESGRVVGLYAEGPDGMIRVNASKGVVIATGGYAYDKAMYMDRHAEEYASHGTFDAFPSCTGDGIKSLLWLGSSMDSIPSGVVFNRCLLTAEQHEGDPYNVGIKEYGYFFYSSQPFLRVDHSGQRFHNESEPYEYVMKTSANRPKGDRFWHQIWDANWKTDIDRFHTTGCSTICYHEGGDHDSFPTMVEDWIEPEMESFVEAGYIVKADTLEELGKALEITDMDAFLATCKRQNENFDNQVDPDFGKEAFRLSELRTPPFYATVKSCGFSLCTTDGIKVDDDLRPYGEDGHAIEGVRVVGNDQGGFYGGVYPNLAVGLNAGRCATFGRLAGKALAQA